MSAHRRAKAPRQPARPLSFQDDDFRAFARPLFRVHYSSGAYPAAWNEFRTYGPLERSRFDPHPLPPGEHPGYGVIYTAPDHATALAEVSHPAGKINLSARTPILSGWQSTRPLRLLDLTGDWPARNGASRALQYAPRSTCRAWARAIKQQAGADTDGLLAEGTLIAHSLIVVLFQPATPHLPPAPELSRALSDPAIAPLIAHAAKRAGLGIVAP